MKKLFLGLALLSSVFAFASNDYYCALTIANIDSSNRLTINPNAEELFFAVINLDKGIALIGFAGDDVSEADDEFKLRLQEKETTQDDDIYYFSANKPKYYPGSMSLAFNRDHQLISGLYKVEEEKLSLVGACKPLL